MWARTIVGALLFVVGVVWIGQGLDVLHGSGMSGQGVWAVIGAVVVLIGLALLRPVLRARQQR